MSNMSEAHAARFLLGMRRLASGVVIVATEHDGERSGLVMTGITSVTAEPPVLLICVNRSASSHDPIARSQRFCVNILRESDTEVAGRFTSPQMRNERFSAREWQPLITGAPALVGCLASLDCEVANTLAAATHTVFFGSVVDVRLWGDDVVPLLYWDGAYRTSGRAKNP
jgi:flavin reductase